MAAARGRGPLALGRRGLRLGVLLLREGANMILVMMVILLVVLVMLVMLIVIVIIVMIVVLLLREGQTNK